MRAIDRLKRDHEILRSKLSVLETALGIGEATWFVLREVCFTLSRQVADHIRREEALVGACLRSLSPQMIDKVGRASVEHRDEPEHLRTINRLFVQEPDHSLARIKPKLLDLIHGLRKHMAEEERELFPVLERLLDEAEAAAAVTRKSEHPHFQETMTVNQVLRDFPRARPTLERFFISVPAEGCICLDEVAWTHGMEAKELLQALEQAIGVAPPEPAEILHAINLGA